MTPAEQQQHAALLKEWQELADMAKKARGLLRPGSGRRAHVHVRSLEAAADKRKRAADEFAADHTK